MCIRDSYNTVPFDPRKPFDPSGIRLGTPAVTTRGLGIEQMPKVAEWIDRAVEAANNRNDNAIEQVAGEVRELLTAYPMSGWA